MTVIQALKYLVLACLTIAVTGCYSNPKEEAKVENADKYFGDTRLEKDAQFMVEYAAFMNLSLLMADIAADKAVRPEVQLFASEMKKDHQMLQDTLFTLAQNFAIELPTQISKEQFLQTDALKSAMPEFFDDLYLSKVLHFHSEIEDDVQAVIEETKKDEILDLARLISAHQFRHIQRASNLKDDA